MSMSVTAYPLPWGRGVLLQDSRDNVQVKGKFNSIFFARVSKIKLGIGIYSYCADCYI